MTIGFCERPVSAETPGRWNIQGARNLYVAIYVAVAVGAPFARHPVFQQSDTACVVCHWSLVEGEARTFLFSGNALFSRGRPRLTLRGRPQQ